MQNVTNYIDQKSFLLKKVKNIVLWKYVINDLTGEGILGIFYEKELKKVNQTEFRVEKVKNIKVDKFYVQWKR